MDTKVSFAADIRPLFRELDVECMKDKASMDLSDYNDVKLWAQSIYDELASKHMPKDGAFWTDAQLALFKSWMDTGMKP